ncbi:MAG: cation transporter [Clostridia bacterium]|nr:cation transporter [Clostridia bacterium]MBQ7788345.1 cation transporter [Clostridia bacterium]
MNKIIKDYNKPEMPEVRVRIGRFAGFVGIIANAILFIIKLVVGILTGGVSIIADSLNNLSDSASNVLTVVGYTISGKPADKDHPYGHARMEYLCSLIISMFVTFIGIEMLISSAEKLIENTLTEQYSTPMIIIIASTIIVKALIAIFYRRLGKHINSDTLKASALDSIGDVIATSAVVAGMILQPYVSISVDGIVGIVIAVYIIIMGIKLVVESSSTLIGKAPDPNFIHDILHRLKNYEGVLGIHDLVIHSYGQNRCFATVHIEVDSDAEIMHSHDLIDNIEADFLKDGINLVIHMDPVSISDPETNELRAKCLQIVSDLSSEYSHPVSMHDFRIVKGITHTNVIFDISVSNDMPLTNQLLCQELTERIRQINPLYNLVLTIDRDYFSERYGE